MTPRARQPPWYFTTPRATALQFLARRFAEPNAAEPNAAGSNAAGPAPVDPVFTLSGFQQDAVRRARRILVERRGVLIADSVGLGKTYIALALIEDALREGQCVGVVTPAALRQAWITPLRTLARRLDTALAPGSELLGATSLTWTSHTHLGRGTAPDTLYGGLDLVVVDEAHAFRNPCTRRYRALAELARTARLVLITATPVNNSLDDLYALLRLFAADGAFRDLGIADLAAAIRAAGHTPHTERDTHPLQTILRAIMIRRTRELVQGEGKDEGPGSPPVRFPRRAPALASRYSLDDVYAGFLPELTATLEALTLAPFRLASYGATTAGARPSAPAELIRLGLLKRLESSLAAFRASITRQYRFANAFLESLERGLLRLPSEHCALYGRGDEPGAQLALEEFTLRPLPPELDLPRLRHDAIADLQQLEWLRSRLRALTPAADSKLGALREILEREVRGEKVVVFTEFRETARYLWRELRPRGACALIDGGGAFLGSAPAGRQEVITRFAPGANHAPAPPPHERVDLLIATDVLAEGLNLQDARHVISYDLPWNPVRLIQRIGRVDRIASPHDVVRPYHFLPDQGLEELLRLMTRLRTKLTAIRQAAGRGAETAEGTGEAMSGGLHVGLDLDDGATAEEALRAAYYLARSGSAQNEAPTSALPVVSSIAIGSPSATPTLLIACRIGRQVLFLLHSATRGGAITEDDTRAAEILLAALTLAPAAPPPTSPPTPDLDLLRRAWRQARRFVLERSAMTHSTEPLPAHSPGARAARRLLAALSTSPGDPDPALCRRIDMLLPRLARRHDAGTDARILAALRQMTAPRKPDQDATVPLIQALEDAVPSPHATAPAGPVGQRAEDEIELIGIIQVRPPQPAHSQRSLTHPAPSD